MPNQQLSKNKVYKGMQIAYIPNHAKGSIAHLDVEFGFVTSANEQFAFCRYWAKESWNDPANPEEHGPHLRTTLNSEATPYQNLVPFRFVSDQLVADTIDWIENKAPKL